MHRHSIHRLIRRSTTSFKRQLPPITKRYQHVYAWGTSKKGTIPLPLTSDGNSHTLDYPQGIDSQQCFPGAEGKLKELVCGHDTSAAVFEDGRCYTWGDNESGQLGQGHNNDNIYRPTPLPESDLTQIGVRHIALHSKFSAAIDAYGDLHTFGYCGSALSGGVGCLAHGNGESFYRPKRVESLVEDGCLVDQVGVGSMHLTVLTTEGEVLTAGAGSYGRLGNLEPTDQLYLEPVELLLSENVTQITVGHAFNLALTKENVIFAWGRNDKGQLGVGGGLSVDMYAMENLPQPIGGQLEGRKIVKVDAGYAHSAAITDDGQLFMWGMGAYLEPQLMTSMLHSKCIDIACGQNYTMILTDKHQLYSFGKNKTGVLGHANTKTLNHPELVEGLADKKVVSMSAGSTHFACLVEDAEEQQEEEEAK